MTPELTEGITFSLVREGPWCHTVCGLCGEVQSRVLTSRNAIAQFAGHWRWTHDVARLIRENPAMQDMPTAISPRTDT